MSFWQQAALAAVGPVVAAGLGGLVVGFIVQRAQDRRNALSLRADLIFEMMQVAYTFYYRTEEEFWRERNKRPPSSAGLDEAYREFRVAARVLEAKLHAYFQDGMARWLWHGVIDLLNIRYYKQASQGEHLDDLVARCGRHSVDIEIPPSVRPFFLTQKELQDDEAVKRRFAVMLNEAINLMLSRGINMAVGGPAILSASVDPP